MDRSCGRASIRHRSRSLCSDRRWCMACWRCSDAGPAATAAEPELNCSWRSASSTQSIRMWKPRSRWAEMKRQLHWTQLHFAQLSHESVACAAACVGCPSTGLPPCTPPEGPSSGSVSSAVVPLLPGCAELFVVLREPAPEVKGVVP
ncbi:hypothetical protein BC831DRAFT_117770 [Entophlyctis helioformis]|nr:hypothetical protein BC831DRAFT_117770 [Entophlyctis helioformis]